MSKQILADYTLVALPDLMSMPQECEENEMTTRFRDFKVSEYWNLAWPFLGVLVLGVVIHSVEERFGRVIYWMF